MRPERNRTPRWNRLNLIMALVVGALILEHGLHLTPTDHKILLVAIVVGAYVWMGHWVSANAAALEDLDAELYREQSRDPADFGTRKSPTHAQARFREVMSFYRHEPSGK